MRIISGSAGGVRLQVPAAVARPTSDRVREALFSILGVRVDGAAVLDLFAGSGALGIEALSRGARGATFVDRDRRARAAIAANLAKAGFTERAVVVGRDACAFLRAAAGRFDLVFADPPYVKRAGDADFAARLLAAPQLPGLLAEDGMVVLESARGHAKNVPAPGWELVDSRSYGDTEISFFQPRGAAA